MNKRNKNLHTVLGANGAVGQAVTQELNLQGLAYRAVSKSIDNISPNSLRANLLNSHECEAAVAGSTFVYLCVGLPYSTTIWERDWEIIMQNVITACSEHKANLIFLDNVYMYASPLPIPFDESVPQEPSSKKGVVRKRVADMLEIAMKQNKVQALIGRAADFYGKRAVNSVLYLSFLERILKGKNPRLLSKGNKEHTFANISDIGRALVKLALCQDCYQQVWHLPVGRPITMQELLAIINRHLGNNYSLKVMPQFMKKVLPIFVPMIKEALEMEYQFNHKYVMSDKKFKNRFPNFKCTSYEEGIPKMIDYFKGVS